MSYHTLMIPIIVLLLAAAVVQAEDPKKPRARDLGIPFDGTTGRLNAITDVTGLEVGFTTLIAGEGKLKQGVGPVRTGVTAREEYSRPGRQRTGYPVTLGRRICAGANRSPLLKLL